jgi:hypothetical protein
MNGKTRWKSGRPASYEYLGVAKGNVEVWLRSNPRHVIRYRIKRRAALQTLINIAANPPSMPEEIDA